MWVCQLGFLSKPEGPNPSSSQTVVTWLAHMVGLYDLKLPCQWYRSSWLGVGALAVKMNSDEWRSSSSRTTTVAPGWQSPKSLVQVPTWIRWLLMQLDGLLSGTGSSNSATVEEVELPTLSTSLGWRKVSPVLTAHTAGYSFPAYHTVEACGVLTSTALMVWYGNSTAENRPFGIVQLRRAALAALLEILCRRCVGQF